MKKLKKLQINTEKLMKNEELLALRGGYSSWTCNVFCQDYTEYHFPMSSIGDEQWYAEISCAIFFNGQFSNCQCICDPA